MNRKVSCRNKKKRQIKTRKYRKKQRAGAGASALFSSIFSSKPKAIIPSNTNTKSLLIDKAKKNENISNSNSMLSELANDSGAIKTAAAISGATFILHTATTGLAASGVGLPLAGMMAGILLITNKMAKLYINNKKMMSLLYDVLNIITHNYKLNELINRTLDIFTIYIYNQDEYPILVNINNIFEEDENKQSNIAKLGAMLSINEQDFSNFLNNANINKINIIKELQKQKNIKKQNGGGYNKKYNSSIVGFVSISEDIKTRISEKLNILSSLLLKNAKDDILTALKNDKEIQESGLIKVIDEEINQRNKSMSKTLGKINRGMDRAFNAAVIMDDITRELTVINGLFIILKTQYDNILELYEREIDDWKEIWKIIENTKEYNNFLTQAPAETNIEEVKNAIEVLKPTQTQTPPTPTPT